MREITQVNLLLREARARAGITQRQLAGRMGTSQSAIAALEQADANPTIATLHDAFDALGLELKVSTTPKVRNVDESLIRRQLALTPSERLESLAQMNADARRLGRARRG